MKSTYTFHGHIITLNTEPNGPITLYHASDSDVGALTCATASIPQVVARAVFFMHVNSVRVLVVDGVEVKRDS